MVKGTQKHVANHVTFHGHRVVVGTSQQTRANTYLTSSLAERHLASDASSGIDWLTML